MEMSDNELLKIRNFGEKSLEELHQKLAERGISRDRQETPEKKTGVGARPAKTRTTTTEVPPYDIDDLMGATLVAEPVESREAHPLNDAAFVPEEDRESS